MAEERVVSASDIKVLYDEYIPKKVEENTKQITENIKTIEGNTQQIQNNIQTIQDNAQQIQNNVQTIQGQVTKITEIEGEVDALTPRVDKLEKLGIKKKTLSGQTTEFGNLDLTLSKDSAIVLSVIDNGSDTQNSTIFVPHISKGDSSEWWAAAYNNRTNEKLNQQQVSVIVYYIDITDEQISEGL